MSHNNNTIDRINKYRKWPTTVETAKKIGMSPGRLIKLRDSDQNPFRTIRIGKAIRFDPSTIDRYLESLIEEPSVTIK